ncbi:MAG: IS66 family insertion sequence element accessory protein TnpB [Gammaproteobacteria bacterium]
MKRRSQAQWRALFQQQQSSRQTAAAFCRARGICPKYFSLRRRQLLGDSVASGAEAAEAFVPVVMPRSVAVPALEVRLGETLALHVPTSVAPRWLAELLHALRG